MRLACQQHWSSLVHQAPASVLSQSHCVGLCAMVHVRSIPEDCREEGNHCQRVRGLGTSRPSRTRVSVPDRLSPQGQPRPLLQILLSLWFTCGWHYTKETPLGIYNTRRNPQQGEPWYALCFPGPGALPVLLEHKREERGGGSQGYL